MTGKSLIAAAALVFLAQSNAYAKPDMSYCRTYMQSPTYGTSQYYPVGKDGDVDVAALKEMSKKKQANFTLKNDEDEVNSSDGTTGVSVRVNKVNGQIGSIQVSKTMAMAGGMLPDIHKVTDAHNFMYVNDTCVPDTHKVSTFMTNVGNGISESEVTFKANECRALHEFFAKYPDLKACGDLGAGNKLSDILAKTRTMVNVAAEKKAVNDTFYRLKRAYDVCQSVPGLKEALKKNELWPSEATDEKKNRPGPKGKVM